MVAHNSHIANVQVHHDKKKNESTSEPSERRVTDDHNRMEISSEVDSI